MTKKELVIGLINIKARSMDLRFGPLTDCIIYLMKLDEKWWKEINDITDASFVDDCGGCHLTDTPPEEIYRQLLKYKK